MPALGRRPRRVGRRLGIEVTPTALFAADIRSGAIVRAAQIPVPLGRDLAVPLRNLQVLERIGRAPVYLVVCDAEHTHRSLLVPPMSAREHAAVVDRETAREREENRVTAWRHLRRLEVDGLPKDELLVVSAPATTVQPAVEALVAERMAPHLVTSGPLALLAAAQSLTPAPLTAPTALVHWGASTLMIVIVSEGMFRFARVVTPPAADLDPLDWMPVEIERSIRHYAIQAKGERVEQVMVSVADADAAGRVFRGGGLAERLRLPLANLNALLAPHFARPVNAEGTGAYILAYGAALLRPSDVPNLLPRALTIRRRSRQVLVAAAMANAAAVVLVASAWTNAREDTAALRSRIEQARTELRAQEVRVAETARVENERRTLAQRASLLTADPLKLLPLGAALKELAHVAPGSLRLDQLTVSTEAQSYVLTLTGGVYQSDVAEAQRLFNEFYYGLRASPLFYDVQVQQTSRPVQRTQDADGDDAGPSLPFVLVVKSKRLI